MKKRTLFLLLAAGLLFVLLCTRRTVPPVAQPVEDAFATVRGGTSGSPRSPSLSDRGASRPADTRHDDPHAPTSRPALPWYGQRQDAIRARLFSPDAVLISGQPLAVESVLELVLFDDVAYRAQVTESFINVNGTVSTLAQIEGSRWGRIVTAYTDGELRIAVNDPDRRRTYAVQYNHADGQHYALEIAPEMEEARQACGLTPDSPFIDPPPAVAEEAPARETTPASMPLDPPTRSEADTPAARIDIMVVYPEEIVNYAGSIANLNNIVAIGTAFANDAHTNTDTGMYFELVYTVPLTGYTPSDSLDTELDRVSQTSNSMGSQVAQWRNTYGADFVTILTSEGSGLGFAPNNTVADATKAFSAIGWRSFDSYTAAHEIGHNMGLHHSKFQPVNTGNPQLPTGTDAAGWHWHEYGNPFKAGFTSVMAYNEHYTYGAGGPTHTGHQRLGVFSDPTITDHGQQAGHIEHANCARVLRARKDQYAAFRTRPRIGSPEIILTRPNSGDTWQRGTRKAIAWVSKGFTGKVKLELYKGSVLERDIATSTLNDLVYYWDIPLDLPSGGNYRIRISSIDSPEVADFSEGSFMITESIFSTDLDTDPGFTQTGDWAYGVPTGNNRDMGGPFLAASGTKIFDTNLDGKSTGSSLLTTGPIDCSLYERVFFSFKSWYAMGSDYTAGAQISTNGTDWTTLDITRDRSEKGWRLRSYDVSTYAARQSSVYFRWSHAATDPENPSSENLAGMSIDDIVVAGIPPKALIYSGISFPESVADDGTVEGELLISLQGETFTADVVSSNHIHVNNLPAGLTPTFTRVSDNRISFSLQGAATAHAYTNNVSDLGISFDDGAFVGGSAASVVRAVRTDLTVDFFDNVTYTLLSPNGGEAYRVGDSVPITWTSSVASGPVNLFLWQNNTLRALIAAGIPDTGSYTWVPSTSQTGDSLRIIVASASPRDETDYSDAPFSCLAAIYHADMDSDPDWTIDAGWEFGVPQGQGGDPTSGYTGSNVIGYNLNGAYDQLPETRYATTPPIDCRNFTGAMLSFRRWLGVGAGPNDHANIEISNDGLQWTEIWANPANEVNINRNLGREDNSIQDTDWQLQTFDISAVADGQSSVYVRFGMGGTDSSAFFAGWNIDDVSITGAAPLPTLSYSSTVFTERPANDGSIETNVSISLKGDFFTANAVSDNHIHVTNLPAGLTATFKHRTNTEITLTLEGNATAHSDGDDVANIGIRFDDGAFIGGFAAAIVGSDRTDLAIDFFTAVVHTILTPNGGEVYNEGDEVTITWTTSGNSGPIDLLLFRGDTQIDTIAAAISNTGSRKWSPLSRHSGSSLRIRIQTRAASESFDMSDDFFGCRTPIYVASLDSNPGWVLDSGWEYGVPQGQGGDPSSGYTGTNVIGYNLNGEYEELAETRYATTSAIDCSPLTGSMLSVRRWLGVESSVYDHANIEISRDGTDWTEIWANSDEIPDIDWQLQTFDISAIADGVSTVYVRFGMGVTDSSVFYSGWNIDDFMISGFLPTPSLTYSPAVFAEAPANDGSIDNIISIQLSSATFSERVVIFGDVTAGNVPEGLTAQFTRVSDHEITMALSGKAIKHDAADDVHNLSVDFSSQAFVGGSADIMGTHKSDLVVDFNVNPYTVTFITDGTPGASLTGAAAQTVSPGASTGAVTANEPPGFHFTGWTGGITSTDNPLTVPSVTGNLLIVANYTDTLPTVAKFFATTESDAYEEASIAIWPYASNHSFDPNIDVDAVPGARIYLTDPNTERHRPLSVDTRPPSLRLYWQLHVVPDTEPLMLSWDMSAFNDGRAIWLQPMAADRANGPATNISLSNMPLAIVRPTTFSVIFAPAEAINLQLVRGWNWITMPLVGDNQLDDILAPDGIPLTVGPRWQLTDRGARIPHIGNLYPESSCMVYSPVGGLSRPITGVRPDGILPVSRRWRAISFPDDIPAFSEKLADLLSRQRVYRWIPVRPTYIPVNLSDTISKDAIYFVTRRPSSTAIPDETYDYSNPFQSSGPNIGLE